MMKRNNSLNIQSIYKYERIVKLQNCESITEVRRVLVYE